MNPFKKYWFYKKLMDTLNCDTTEMNDIKIYNNMYGGSISWYCPGLWGQRCQVTAFKERYTYDAHVYKNGESIVFFGKRRSKKLYRAAYQVAMAQQQREELESIKQELRELRKKSR